MSDETPTAIHQSLTLVEKNEGGLIDVSFDRTVYTPAEFHELVAELARAEAKLANGRVANGIPDVRQADLWLCWDCCVPHLNVGQPRECTICGGDLEYQGEVPYHDKELGGEA